MRDKILKLVREKGPVLPVEIANRVGVNSLLANAYLEELAESNEIIASKEKVGSVHLFFVKGQESKVKERVQKLVPVSTPASYATKPIRETPELAFKRKEFAERLERIEREERTRKIKAETKPKSPVSPSKPREHQMKIIPKKPAMERAKSFLKGKFSPAIKPPANLSKNARDKTLINTALDYLRDKSIIIIGEPKEISSREHELMVSVPSGVGPVRFLVKVKSKKKVNRSDLMQYYAEALERRMPVVLFSDGELASTAKSYLKDAGGFLRVKLFN